MSEAPEPKRLCLSKKDLNEMTKEEIVGRWIEQERYLDLLEVKANDRIKDNSELVSLRESEEKLKQQQAEATRRENVLVMRLTTKEQEMQEYANQIQELKQAQVPGTTQLRSTLVDPAVNLMFERMKKGLDSTKAKLEETQNDLSAWKFTPDSNTGKRLMAKCRLLHQENEELGKMISSGRIAKLEGDLALQRNFSEEMKKSQADLDEFLMELDEDVEGMQSTIYYLQQQLRETKEVVTKLQQENQRLRTSAVVTEMEEDDRETEEMVVVGKINVVSLTPPRPTSETNDVTSRNPVSLNPERDLLMDKARTNDDVDMVPIEELDQSDAKKKVPFVSENNDNSKDTVVDDLHGDSRSPSRTENSRSPRLKSPKNSRSPTPTSPEKSKRPITMEFPENSRSPRPASTEFLKRPTSPRPESVDNSRSPRSAMSEFVENSRSPRPTSRDDSRSPRRESSEHQDNSRSPRTAVSESVCESSRSPRRTSPKHRFDAVDRDMDSSPVLEIDMDASPSECETDLEQRTIQTPPPLEFRTSRENVKEDTKDVRKDADETTKAVEKEVVETTKVNDRSLTNSLESREQFVEEDEDIEMGDDELVIDCPQTAVNGNGYDDEEEEETAASEHSDSESQSLSSTEDNSRQTLTPSPRTPETPPPRDSYTPPRESYTPPLPPVLKKDVKVCKRGEEITDSVHLDGETNCTKVVISRDSAVEQSEFVVTATKKPTLNGISATDAAPAASDL